jgi:hypothetical protein
MSIENLPSLSKEALGVFSGANSSDIKATGLELTTRPAGLDFTPDR